VDFTDRLYNFLDRIGYLHPIHPAMTHMPIGLVVGALFFGWGALLFRRQQLARAAYASLVLAFLFVFPTVVFGYMDWQRYYAGVLLHPVEMKLAAAGTLAVVMLVGLVVGFSDPVRLKALLPVYTLCFACVVVLGYYGGQLVYSGNTPAAPKGQEKRYAAGLHVFDSRCSGCHRNGGNILRPNLPLRNAPELKTFETFEQFLRDPKLPNGKKGPMPAFTTKRVSSSEARELYKYIVDVIANPKRE
jgi:uncharacterized membrane protein